MDRLYSAQSCILLNFYIKPQRYDRHGEFIGVVSYWISTSNHNSHDCFVYEISVVSYWISTSNHNNLPPEPGNLSVVSYWISTSNHNNTIFHNYHYTLYLIEFLHQTTTLWMVIHDMMCCILLNFYIKPQHTFYKTTSHAGCILLNFYIKPQQSASLSHIVNGCILLNFYIKPQPYGMLAIHFRCCILLNFYIKPQQSTTILAIRAVVSYWISTSNHNLKMNCEHPIWVVSYWISTSNHNAGLRLRSHG